MLELHPIVLAAITGFLSGLIISIPVGPVNLTIMNEGARNGFKPAGLIGLGATLMEVIYCALAFTSFASFFSRGPVEAAMQVFSFAFMLFLGTKFLLANSVPGLAAMEHRIESRIEQKLHPHSAFWTGFVRTMANPGVLLGWVVLGANFISRGWVEPNHQGKLSCLAGVAAGVGIWFFGLSWAASLGHKKLTERGLLRLQRGSGVVLLGLGLAHGVHLAWQLTKHMKTTGVIP
jgi:threonine/homoserine/homoserine lactone efflux protein